LAPALTTTATSRDAETGQAITEGVPVPAGGNATVSTKRPFDRVDSITLPASGGTAAALTDAGYSAPQTASSSAVAGIAIRKAASEPIGGEMAFADGDMLSVLRKGTILAEIDQDLTAGTSDLFVRVEASTSELAGSFRADADSDDAVRVPAGSFRILQDADESAFALAKMEVRLP
jgi:hypothetical protein